MAVLTKLAQKCQKQGSEIDQKVDQKWSKNRSFFGPRKCAKDAQGSDSRLAHTSITIGRRDPLQEFRRFRTLST